MRATSIKRRLRRNLASLATVTASIIAVVACSSGWETAALPDPEPSDAGGTASADVRYTSAGADWCTTGNDSGQRLNDLAEHVYDGAVADYLLDNASDIGRETAPDSLAYALMLLVDDAAYETCVTFPERCLRAEFRRTASVKERDALLSGKAAYTRARACLQRAGDNYVAHDPVGEVAPEREEELTEVYQERVLPHLVGNLMPVALLDQSSYFGVDNDDLHEAAAKAWQECYETLSRIPLDPERLVHRVSRDLVAPLRCAEALPQTGSRPAESRRQ